MDATPNHCPGRAQSVVSNREEFDVKQRLVTVIFAVALAIGLSVLTAPAASAQQYLFYQNAQTGRCWDDSAQYGLRAFPCNGGNYQQWTYNGQYRSFRNLNTGRCIDDSVQFGLRAFPCNFTVYQRWYPYSAISGYTQWQNQNTTGCIDDSAGAGLRSFGCNSSRYQAWRSFV